MKKLRFVIVFILLAGLLISACSSISGDAGGASAEKDSGDAEVSSSEEEMDTEPEPEDAEADAPEADTESESADTGAETTSSGKFHVEKMQAILDTFILRPKDMPDSYRLPSGGESRYTNLALINEIGELKAKEYIVATGRVDGWSMVLERAHKADIAPAEIENYIELFETAEGAQLAISPEWYKIYQDDAEEATFVDGGCDIGDECLFYFHEKFDSATNLTTQTYEIAFTYRNALVWVMGRGLDIDITPEYMLDVAQIAYDKLDQYGELE